MNKQAEKDRLRPLLFEGAIDWCTHVALEADGIWFWLQMPWCDWTSGATGDFDNCKNQPETFLDWTETLIKKGDL